MGPQSRVWPIVMVVLGIVGLIMGVVFIYQGVSKSHLLKEAMRVENVALTFVPGYDKKEIIDCAPKAMAAANVIREHRRKIAPTYMDLLGGKKFDPSKHEQLDYAQALNLENYLYFAVVGLGLTQLTTASGVFMVLMGIAIGGTGIRQLKSISSVPPGRR